MCASEEKKEKKDSNTRANYDPQTPNPEPRTPNQTPNPKSEPEPLNPSLKNMSKSEGGKTRTTIFTNLGTNWELADFPVCMFDEKALFSSIEVNYPMLMSPIQMIPTALPNAKVQVRR